MERLPIKIDPEVFKLKDPRVRKLLSAGISVEAFALLARPGDPWMLIGNCIYALTEQEFYAMRALLPVNVFTESAFKYVLGLADLSFMDERDRSLVEEIRKQLPTCPACRYKKYKNEALRLVRKYQIKLPEGLLKTPAEADRAEYPEVEGEIRPVVSVLLAHMYEIPKLERKPCMDCVEKHIAQAWILGNESLLGYPEHLTLAVGHLAEALEELPAEAVELKRTLEFCMARTNYYKRPFIPVYLLLPFITMARQSAEQTLSVQSAEDNSSRGVLDIDLTEPVLSDLRALPDKERMRVRLECLAIDDYAAKSADSTLRIAWEGAMGALADSLAATAPHLANLIRNRRLLFVADPSLAAPSGYAMQDLVDSL